MMRNLITLCLSLLVPSAVLTAQVSQVEAVKIEATGVAWADNSVWAAYICTDEAGRSAAHISFTRDMARTWETVFASASCDSIALQALPDGGVRAFLRDTTGRCSSMDYSSGNWSAAVGASFPEPFRPAMPAPATGVGNEVFELPSGHLLMLRNCRMDEYLYVLPDCLYAYLSDDGGETWYGGLKLDERPFSVKPKLAVAPGGRLIILFSNNFRSSCAIYMAMTTEKEIAAASGSFSTKARIVQPVLGAGQGLAQWRRKMAVLTEPKQQYGKKPLRIATYNIQYPAPEAPDWQKRIVTLGKFFKAYNLDVFGSQEPYLFQIKDIEKSLGDDYAWVSVNRDLDPDKPKSHYNPIFYRKSRLELLEWGTFWYSAIPGKATWGSSSARFCTWAKFRDKANDLVFYHFNSHFDHIGLEIRTWSAYMLIEKAAEISGGYPAFFTGDFNSDESTRCYREITGCGFISDSMRAVDTPLNIEYRSITGYKSPESVSKDWKHIDHVFYTPANSKVLRWELVANNYGGVYGSDHHPIVVDWKIANK